MADDDLKELLKRNLEVSEKSLEILKKMRHAQLFGRIFKIAYWAIIILIVAGAYYYLHPVFKNLISVGQNFYNEILEIRKGNFNRETIPPATMEQLKGILQNK